MSEAANSSVKTSSGEVSQVVEHLFRHEWGKMVATLTGIFGLEHLTLAEDVVQETLSRALQTWPFYGVPQNPSAWIMRAARNLAVDFVRRQKVFRGKEAEIVRLIELNQPEGSPAPQEIADDRLRMMFVCCHPAIPADAQVALALKTLCGFSIAEIARAFLATDAAIAKRLTRAKQEIRDARVPFEIPSGPDLAARVEGVLRSLYFLFNEGYKASTGGKLVREDVCQEAVRLTTLLVRHPAGDRPETHALLALMWMNAARLPARTDDDGNLVRLEDQDRSQWNQEMIAQGMFHFAQSGAGEKITPYHLQAAIMACHCAAREYASTDWPRILELYDRLMEVDASPVVALNRAVAMAKVRGAEEGLAAVRQIADLKSLETYYLLYAVLGDLESRSNRPREAIVHFQKSLELVEIQSERALLAKRLAACQSQLQEAARA